MYALKFLSNPGKVFHSYWTPTGGSATIYALSSPPELEGIITSDAAFSPLRSLDFDVTIKGSGKLQFTLAYPPDFPVYHMQGLQVFLMGESEPYWSGFLCQVPGSMRSDGSWKYRALGWSTALAWPIISQFWALSGLNTRTMISCGICNFACGLTSPLLFDPDLLTLAQVPTSSHPSITPKAMPGPELWETFEQIMGSGWVLGVDNDRRVTFGPLDNTMRQDNILVIGRDIIDWEPETDSSRLWNFGVVRGGPLNDSTENGNEWSPYYRTNLLGEVQDSPSINQYWLRGRVVNASSELDIDRALAHGATELAGAKDPADRAIAPTIPFDSRRWDPGQLMQIRSLDYEELDTFRILRIEYDLVRGRTLHLGAEDDTLEAQFAAAKSEQSRTTRIATRVFVTLQNP